MLLSLCRFFATTVQACEVEVRCLAVPEVRVRVGVRVRFMVRFRFRVRFRFSCTFRVSVSVRVTVKVRVRFTVQACEVEVRGLAVPEG